VGTLLRAGPRLRANAQLVHLPDASVAWSAAMETPVDDVLRIQDDLARRIAESLTVTLSAHDRSSMLRKLPATPRANELYLRANAIAGVFDMLPAAHDLYRECLQEDPRFAPAWARLGRVFRVMGKYGYTPSAEGMAAAEQAFQKALALDPELALAHHLYAYFEVEERGRARDAMVRLIERARACPTDAEVFAALVMACRFCGLLDASVAADARARRLEPGIRTSIPFTHWVRGEAATALSLDDDPLRWMRLYALPALGRETDAIHVARDMESHASPGVRPMVATTGAALERDAERCIAATESVLARGLSDPESLYVCARNLARVDATERALGVLQRVVEGGYHNPRLLAHDAWLDGLRGLRRFADLEAAASEGRERSRKAYQASGGPALLGALEEAT
jgi:tetratricopeptide (TPR) repeat protein